MRGQHRHVVERGRMNRQQRLVDHRPDHVFSAVFDSAFDAQRAGESRATYSFGGPSLPHIADRIEFVFVSQRFARRSTCRPLSAGTDGSAPRPD